jgi:hypothetical protein
MSYADAQANFRLQETQLRLDGSGPIAPGAMNRSASGSTKEQSMTREYLCGLFLGTVVTAEVKHWGILQPKGFCDVRVFLSR